MKPRLIIVKYLCVYIVYTEMYDLISYNGFYLSSIAIRIYNHLQYYVAYSAFLIN